MWAQAQKFQIHLYKQLVPKFNAIILEKNKHNNIILDILIYKE